jgi:histidinol-phosphate/aromatic aminotransferase/cobyric acid decarboxylase-like protein
VIEHHEEFRRIWAELRDVRADAEARLRGWGASPLPSGGNFLAVRVGTAAEAAAVTDRVAEAGYRIRDLSPLPGLHGCIRFTIADAATTGAFLSVLRAALPQGAGR